MWIITVRDLQYRARQFAIAVAGAGLVFAVTLILTGMSAGFRHEARSVVGAMDADAWIVPRGVTGPFTAQTTMPASLARTLQARRDVLEAHPLAEFSHVAALPDGSRENINVLGHDIGGLGDPEWGGARARRRPGEAVVDERLGVHEGDRITIASHRLRVAAVVHDRSYYAGVPVVYLDLREAQRIGFEGRPLASAILTRGAPRPAPRGLSVLTNADVRDDLLTPMDGARTAIDLIRAIMWIVAAVIIAAVTYVSALERARDFAVLKAVGGSSRSLAVSLAVQAVLASLLAALLGAGLAQVLAPAFPMPVVIERGVYLALPLIAVVVGVLASLTALRRAIRVDPALAFAG
jgi:putative ABC transport system permease protein